MMTKTSHKTARRFDKLTMRAKSALEAVRDPAAADLAQRSEVPPNQISVEKSEFEISVVAAGHRNAPFKPVLRILARIEPVPGSPPQAERQVAIFRPRSSQAAHY